MSFDDEKFLLLPLPSFLHAPVVLLPEITEC
jgi:hypothetical protein